MFKTIDEAVIQFTQDHGEKPESHHFRVWEKNGLYWATEANIIEPDARQVPVRQEPGVWEWEEA